MLSTDLDSCHIEGYAIAAQERGIDSYFSVPLISHITGNLWMGGCRDGVELPEYFINVVSLYSQERYILPKHTHHREFKMYDSAVRPDAVEVMHISNVVAKMMDEGPTLVHCQAGLNRSGLISALALMSKGWTGLEAVKLLRERRSELVLCNKTFEEWVLA